MILIGLLSVLIIIFFFSLTISVIFEYRFEQSLPVAFFSIAFLLYVVGIIFDNLAYGFYSVLFLFFLSIIFVVYSTLNKKIIWKKIFTIGFVLFFFSVGIFSLVHKNTIVESWDEFSHWALVNKNMFIFNKFGSYLGATTCFKSYPPSVSLLLYFMQKVAGKYTPQLLFIGMKMLFFSLISPIFKGDDFKDWKKSLSNLLIIILVPNIFYDKFFDSLYVDAMLSLVFAYILFIYFSEKLSWKTIVNISLATFFLVNIKAAGSGLAIMLIVIFVLDIIFIKNKHNAIKTKMIFLVSVSGFYVFAKKSWELFLINSDNNPQAWSTSAVNKANLAEFISGSAPNYRYDVLLSFSKGVFTTPITENVIRLSYFMCIIFVLVILYLLYKNTENAKRMRLLTAVFGFFSCAYAVSMLILYLFTFSEYEATILASFQRYMSIYALGIVAFSVYQMLSNDKVKLVEERNKLKRRVYSQKRLLVLVAILCISNISSLIETIAINPVFVSAGKKEISKTRLRQESIANSLDINSRVYIIAQNTNGFEYWQSRYNFTPIHINDSPTWSLGDPYYSGDIWTKNISLEQWEEILYNDYNYVYLEKIDDIFVERYGSLFSQPPQDDQLYTISVNNDNKVILSPVFT